MKKIILILLCLFLVSCNVSNVKTDIPNTNFSSKKEMNEFSNIEYLENILDSIESEKYQRTRFDEEDSKKTIDSYAIENIYNIFNLIDPKDTYTQINFFDYHLNHLELLAIDIILFEIISNIENNYSELVDIVNRPEFLYITRNSSNRLTNSYLLNYTVTEEDILKFPNINEYLNDIYKIINGGYQIRMIEDKYYIFIDYASILVRYDKFYSKETKKATEALVSISRDIVKINNKIIMDNEGIAFYISKLENFLEIYPNSRYHGMFKKMYVEYFKEILTNPNNLEKNKKYYKKSTVVAFDKLANRYSNTIFSSIINEFSENIKLNEYQYDQKIIDELLIEIENKAE